MARDDHPMYEVDRPLIPTRPIERLGDAISLAMEAGHRGIWIFGDGRVGKTKGARILSRRREWLPWPTVFCEVNYSNPERPSESYFFNCWLNAGSQRTIQGALGTDVLARTRNYLIELTKSEHVKVIACLMNESNRFTLREFEHLVSLENDIEKFGKRLFLILLSQTDADEDGPQGIDRRPPSNIFGRFLTASHHFTGLLWEKLPSEMDNGIESDVSLALAEYDNGIWAPNAQERTCSHYFAPRAFDAGWRLASQIELFRFEIESLRAKHGLPATAPWPMKTFEAFAYFALVRIAGEDPQFMQFTPEQVQLALRLSGYIELELSRYPERK